MAILLFLFFGALSVVIFSIVLFIGKRPKKVVFPDDGYFGTGDKKADNPAIVPFKINVPGSSLQELKLRLENARIGHSQLEDVDNFEYGFNLSTLRKFQDYWINDYDWRKYEEKLNSFPQFTTQIEGLKIHFIHAKPPPEAGYKRIIPLLIVHGWPGNVFEFYKIIPMLTDPPFEVIVPSIPGFGWSEQPYKTGFNQMATARVFNKLMVERLKFQKYVPQGGDWGSFVASNIGRMYPERVFGVHLNMDFNMRTKAIPLLHTFVGSIMPRLMFPGLPEYSVMKHLKFLLNEGGYFLLQSTKPDTVGVALNDSPLGLMAYILEKFSVWTNPSFISLSDGGLERKITKDEMLTLVMIYWLNGNILSSQRYYKEFWMDPVNQELVNQYMSVPCAYAGFKHDLLQPVELLRHAMNVIQYNLFDDGGHLSAMEHPDLLATDVFQFVQKVV
ncbi:alpha/beta hydrolase fold domain-containing protein [Ditylenchus destructor]|uniref:Epoxide hydrolase n=1 Tax=Ditylenchus destructor TaxID=166010 RepID=A0AAD4MS84_9BILA|nr:alpha/beta hydrolase fold domain-containing protein [Ditylenchus destructor]